MAERFYRGPSGNTGSVVQPRGKHSRPSTGPVTRRPVDYSEPEYRGPAMQNHSPMSGSPTPKPKPARASSAPKSSPAPKAKGIQTKALSAPKAGSAMAAKREIPKINNFKPYMARDRGGR